MKLKTFLILSTLIITQLHSQTPLPITELLTPLWTKSYTDTGALGYSPNVYSGIIFPPFPGDFYNCENGNLTQSIPDMNGNLIVCKYRINNKKNIEITDPVSGDIKQKIQMDKLIIPSVNYPQVINSDFYFVNRDQLIKYDFTFDSLITIKTLNTLPNSNIIVYKDNFFYTHENKIIFGDISTGEINNELIFNDKVSGMSSLGSLLYVWIVHHGVFCVNLKSHEIIWTFKPERMNYAKIDFIIDEYLYFSSGDLYCVDLYDGNLYWRTKGNCSRLDRYTRVFDNYILNYNTCTEEGDYYPALLELLDKKTGKVLYQGWTSEIFPPDENNEIYLNEMDFYRFSFAFNLCNDILVGISGRTIYAFRFKRE